MKGKIKVVMLLSMLLLFLPTNVFAEDATKEVADLSIESTSLNDNESLENEKSELTEEADKNDSEKTNIESVDNENPTDQKLVEESENDLDSKNQTDTNKDQEVVEENKNTLKEDIQADEAELEIGEEFNSEPVRGVDGGGSGGSILNFLPRELEPNRFIILKADENHKPMRVAFKITDLNTGESHIVVTDADGKSNPVFLNSDTLKPWTGDANFYLYENRIKNLIESGDSLPNGENPEKSEFFGSHESSESNSEPESPSNANDSFLTQPEKPNPYKYSDFYKDQGAYFKSAVNKGYVKVVIRYGHCDRNGSNRTWVHKDTFEYKDLPVDEVPKISTYVDKNGQFTEELRKFEKTVESFSEKRYAALVKEGKLKLPEESEYAISDISLACYQDFSEHTYMVEELRTDTNLNHELKSFYIKSTPRPMLLSDLEPPSPEDMQDPNHPPIIRFSPTGYELNMGYDLNNINTPSMTAGPGPGPGPYPGPYPEPGPGPYPGPGPEPVPVIPSFTIVNEKFNFKTFASHSTNKDEKVLEQGDRTQVTDRISFDKLSVGKEYKFVGKLINKRTGEEVKTEEPIVYETGKLTNPNGEASITITFDSSIYQDGDEFVLVYDIFEDGKLAGFENNHDNPDQSFKIVSTTTPPGRDYPPPKEETPPPKEETPPPKEEVPPVEEVEKESPKQVVEVAKPTPVYMAPKTFDPGIGLNVFTAILSGAALTFLRKRR